MLGPTILSVKIGRSSPQKGPCRAARLRRIHVGARKGHVYTYDTVLY